MVALSKRDLFILEILNIQQYTEGKRLDNQQNNLLYKLRQKKRRKSVCVRSQVREKPLHPFWHYSDIKSYVHSLRRNFHPPIHTFKTILLQTHTLTRVFLSKYSLEVLMFSCQKSGRKRKSEKTSKSYNPFLVEVS